jgi:hypothetical protein
MDDIPTLLWYFAFLVLSYPLPQNGWIQRGGWFSLVSLMKGLVMRTRRLGIESLEGRRLLAAAVHRPIEDFVEAQGAFLAPIPGGLFVPPVANFLGWSDPSAGIGVSIDYAGLADQWIQGETNGEISFGTTFSGQVKEKALKDGTTQIDVVLHTDNALAWAVQFDETPDFTDTLIFGYRAPDVLAGAEPALGSSTLKATIITDQEPGEPLPDLLAVLFGAVENTFITRLQFTGSAKGDLREASGHAEGTPGHVQVTQVGLLDKTGHNGAVGDGFPAEHVVVGPAGKPLQGSLADAAAAKKANAASEAPAAKKVAQQDDPLDLIAAERLRR